MKNNAKRRQPLLPRGPQSAERGRKGKVSTQCLPISCSPFVTPRTSRLHPLGPCDTARALWVAFHQSWATWENQETRWRTGWRQAAGRRRPSGRESHSRDRVQRATESQVTKLRVRRSSCRGSETSAFSQTGAPGGCQFGTSIGYQGSANPFANAHRQDQ